MEEHLLTALIVAPFFITMVGFAVAIAFAPAVPNEIAPATERDHKEEAARIQFIDENGDGPGVKLRKSAKDVEEISQEIDALYACADGAQPRSRHECNEESGCQEQFEEAQKSSHADHTCER